MSSVPDLQAQKDSHYHWHWLLLQGLPVDLATLQQPLTFTRMRPCGQGTRVWLGLGTSVPNKGEDLSSMS